MYKDSELEKILEETHNIYCEVSGHNYDVPKWEETLIKIMEILKTILNTPEDWPKKKDTSEKALGSVLFNRGFNQCIAEHKLAYLKIVEKMKEREDDEKI